MENVWLEIIINAPDSNQYLIAFPFAGGSSLSYRSWCGLIPSNVNFIVINLPGRGRLINQQPLTDLGVMASEISQQLASLPLGEMIFYGHSMGAALAYEVAVLLAKKRAIKHLFCGALAAPHLLGRAKKIYKLSTSEFIEDLRKQGGSPDEVLNNQDLMEILLPMLRSDFQAIETYHPLRLVKLSCPITAFYGEQDHEINIADVAAWSSYTLQQFNIYGLTGNHFFCESEAAHIIAKISAEFNQSTNSVSR